MMDVYCLKRGFDQSDEERNAHLEQLRDSLAPSPEIEAGGRVDATAERRTQLQAALDLLASGTVESICFRSPDVLARSEEDFAQLNSFLSEYDIGLTLAVVGVGPKPTDDGREGADANDIGEAEPS